MEIINPRPKMAPFIRHMLVIPDPIDFEKHKRVKRIMALTEKHKFKKTFLDERALSSSRFYPKKQARELSIGFNMHHNNIKTINRFLKRQPSLNRLSLTFSHKLNDAGWVNIGKSLARFPHLNKLSIHFERTIQKIKDETLDKLRRHLKKLPKLDDVVVKCGTDQPLIFTLNLLQLGLSFTGGLVSISNNFLMDKIIQQTRQLLKLTTIKLDPVMNASITDNALQDLGLALLKLKNLEKVSFNFQKCTAVTLQGVGAFLDILSRAPKLRKIKLGLFLKEKIADTPLNHPLWKLRYFKKVSLDLMFASDCDPSVFDLTMAALQNVSSLYTFQIDLTDCHYVSDGTLENMAGVIKNLSRIQKLHLNFGECQKITDIGVSAIISSIMELRDLTKLFLDFSSCCTIPTANISRNWDGQFSGLQKLTHVSVLFNKCIGLSENLLTEVVNIITDCKQLEQLYLGLNRCEAVRDKTVRGIGKALRKLEQLTSLKLEFGKEQNLFDNVQRRAKRANHITKSLLEVDSDIITNAHIEDKGLIALGKSISRFKMLKDLTLDIKDCDNITQEGLQEFCRCFFNVYNLHKFVLNGNLDNPPRELWKIASELDEKLPHRYLFVMQFRRCSSGTERFARGI